MRTRTPKDTSASLIQMARLGEARGATYYFIVLQYDYPRLVESAAGLKHALNEHGGIPFATITEHQGTLSGYLNDVDGVAGQAKVFSKILVAAVERMAARKKEQTV